MQNMKNIWVTIGMALACCAAQAQMGYIVGTWAASPMEFPAANAGQTGQTLREIVHVSIPGSGLAHVTFSNEFGHEPLTINAVTLAHRTGGSNTDTPVAVTFGGGKTGITIAPGKRVLSDSAVFKFPAQSDVAISLYLPAQPMTSVTGHGSANSTNYIAEGDQTSVAQLTGATEISSWRYIAELDVSTATQSSIVCLGDSITDGSRSTKDANLRWPDLLAARLLTDKSPWLGTRLGVLNEGIGGNRILREHTGPSAIERFDRDVINAYGYYADGRRYIIFLEGINDIGHSFDPSGTHSTHYGIEDRVTAEELIAADHLLIARAHASGLKIIGATLTPYMGAKYSSPEGEKVREALNNWIRTSGEFDGVIDFDKATRDPANPAQYLPAYDSGDHLHPNDAGMKAMADSIDLKLFEK